MVQEAAGAMVWSEHVLFVMEKGAASGFVEPTAPRINAAFPLFVTVTVWLTEELAVTLPKGTCRSVVGATESVTVMAGVGAAAPVPLTFTVTDAFAGSLLGMLKLSEKVPAAAGANATVMVQEAAGAMVWSEHVLFAMANGAESGFVEPTAPITRLAVPELVTVTVWLTEEPAVTLPKGTCRSVAGATDSVTVMAGAGGGAELTTVKELTVTISSPCSGLLLSGRHFVPKNAPEISYWLPYHDA
jgi:hypothetical protein